MTRTVLVVDDDPDVREILSLALSACPGWLVETVAGGAAAVRRCDAGGVDAVVLDLEMPGFDGRRTLRELRAAHAGLPVVFLTAAVDTSGLAELGALGVLAKPFDPLGIGARLAGLLRWDG
ncbi:response regulator [Amycolatopsis sp. OK19-0408]|uniref:Response regulator n=1 Tax=Amycolatopsis iheyensis TaxID=2945988 RepID=A0A9X2SJH7_9PSEU|nr:response regulator [Amycolatopsis iheyensis]MCR6484464.1 response regulator [Amycolatopsis iheyensis]